MNGLIAIGSFRNSPTFPIAAAVVSTLCIAPKRTPSSQLLASIISGIRSLLLPPKRKALTGAPFGFS